MHGFGRQPPARDLALTSKSHVHEGQAETNLLIVVTKRAEERERENHPKFQSLIPQAQGQAREDEEKDLG
jgi:hypothetical protein